MAGGLPLTLAWLALAAPGATPGDDKVVLENGQELTGRVVYEDQRRIVLRVRNRDVELDRDEVSTVSSAVRELRDLLASDARTDGPSRDLELLSEQARECGLEGEERLYLWARLVKDPESEDLNKRLGNRRTGSGWVVRVGSRSMPLARRIEAASDWGSAWEFSSLHYRVRSALELEATLAIVLDLERLYLDIYDLFGEELGLYEICKPMNVALHASSASYPESGAEGGYYEVQTDTIHVNASAGLKWHLLAHEATHQVLQNALLREDARTEGLPPWLNEGLAEYVAAGTEHPDRVLELHPGSLRRDYVDLHATTPKRQRLDLGRVLALETTDYRASSDRDLKYAQSYTLVQFLLDGEGRQYRPGLFDFLRGLERGKRSSTDLKKALGVSSWRVLEKQWSAHVEQL